MPELPEVETVVRALAPRLLGRRIRDAKILRRSAVKGSPQPLTQLRGRRVLAVYRRGKFIRLDLEADWGMAVHLRMTGWLGVVPAHSAKNESHARLYLTLDGGKESLLFRDVRTFGRVWCGPQKVLAQLPAFAKLGPEPLEISSADFVRRLRSHSGHLKPLLLNQSFLAGLGNIYVDESLFETRLHPLTNAAAVKPAQARALHAAIRRILAEAIAFKGTTVYSFADPERRAGRFQEHLRVYGRAGTPCTRCGTEVRRIVVGQRGTAFCPKCQKNSQ